MSDNGEGWIAGDEMWARNLLAQEMRVMGLPDEDIARVSSQRLLLKTERAAVFAIQAGYRTTRFSSMRYIAKFDNAIACTFTPFPGWHFRFDPNGTVHHELGADPGRLHLRFVEGHELPWSVMREDDEIALSVHATKEEALASMVARS